MTDKQHFHLRPDGEQSFGYAQAVQVGNLVYVAGTLSVDDGYRPLHPGDMAGQLGVVYDTLERSLAHFGLALADVVKETVFVTDMAAFLDANARRIAAYGGARPAATAVEVKQLAFPECLVEIEVIAAA